MTQAKIIVAGAAGRMGQAIFNAAREDGVTIVGGVERAGHRAVGSAFGDGEITDRLEKFAGGGVLVDFTAPSAALAHARAWAGAPMVIGTTGFSESEEAEIARIAKAAPVVKSGNFSLGVNLLAALAKKAAAALGPGYDIEIVEAHHRAKADAPSGTALMLGQAAADGRGVSFAGNMRLDRTGVRDVDAIGMAVIRGGGVIGDHEVMFAGASEVVTLSHRALDRGLFARGAIAAARWVAARPPGLYAMADVLGL
ncbi:MAG TPA: 4-hydroxy-tetrahydrodipicolinate reductase [Parvularcula sp.]|nr:4-hydroxy-tetrahydrodipicolinate reductase [Parvularcula sp.]HBS35429.1 4-hydroxy-tetrahydrodipicolinate reductase [Parvularcula sp.]